MPDLEHLERGQSSGFGSNMYDLQHPPAPSGSVSRRNGGNSRGGTKNRVPTSFPPIPGTASSSASRASNMSTCSRASRKSANSYPKTMNAPKQDKYFSSKAKFDAMAKQKKGMSINNSDKWVDPLRAAAEAAMKEKQGFRSGKDFTVMPTHGDRIWKKLPAGVLDAGAGKYQGNPSMTYMKELRNAAGWESHLPHEFSTLGEA